MNLKLLVRWPKFSISGADGCWRGCNVGYKGLVVVVVVGGSTTSAIGIK